MELRKAGDALPQTHYETGPGGGLDGKLFCSFNYYSSDRICSRIALFKRRTFTHPPASPKVQAACCAFSTFFWIIDKGTLLWVVSTNLVSFISRLMVSQSLSYYRITHGDPSAKGVPGMFFALVHLLLLRLKQRLRVRTKYNSELSRGLGAPSPYTGFRHD